MTLYTITIAAIARSTGVRAIELATGWIKESAASPRELAISTAREWYDATDQCGEAEITLRIEYGDRVMLVDLALKPAISVEIISAAIRREVAP